MAETFTARFPREALAAGTNRGGQTAPGTTMPTFFAHGSTASSLHNTHVWQRCCSLVHQVGSSAARDRSVLHTRGAYVIAGPRTANRTPQKKHRHARVFERGKRRRAGTHDASRDGAALLARGDRRGVTGGFHFNT